MRSAVLRSVLYLVQACVPAAAQSQPSAPIQLVASNVVTLRFVGDVNGERADAAVSLERMREYVLAAGRIQSRSALYGFTADIYGDSGFGTILDYGNGSRWQIKIQVVADGFALISNPLGPGTPTTYYFKLVRSQ
jgi:hypothetical protein